MWAHADWFGSLFPSETSGQNTLPAYAKFFNSIEGNTSFYQIPTEQVARRWAQSVPMDFRFTFKFHKDISHTHQLINVESLVEQQLNALKPIDDKLACMLLQLPKSFSPTQLASLEAFLNFVSHRVTIAVEVRHMDFFDKSDNEKALNQLLQAHDASRVIMDTRGLFAVEQSCDPVVVDVQGKKPKVPTHVVSTSQIVVVRYVGHPELSQNKSFYLPWLKKLVEWIEQDKTIYFFFHMPNNGQAPWLAEQFISDFNHAYPEYALPELNLPAQYQDSQIALF